MNDEVARAAAGAQMSSGREIGRAGYLSVYELFCSRVRRDPKALAIEEGERRTSYGELDVRVRRGNRACRASASGRDIYAVTAPLLVEALQRILDGRVRGNGALAAGQAFGARDFLTALAAAVTVTFEAG